MSATRALLVLGLVSSVGLGTPVRADEASNKADEETLRAGGVGSDGPALVKFFVTNTPSEGEQARLAALVRQLGADTYREREQASGELQRAGRLALPLLRPALKDPDPEIVRRARVCVQRIENGHFESLAGAAARLLAVRQPNGATAAVLNHLPSVEDRSLEEELLATLGAVGVKANKVDALLVSALADKRPACRAAAGRVVGRFGSPEQRQSVRRLLADADPVVRLRAAQGLLAARDKTAIPALVGLLGQDQQNLVWEAEDILCRIAGEKAPPVSPGNGDPAERRKCEAAWSAWWRDHGAKVELEKIELEHRSLGLTLFVVYDGFPGGGRIWETGTDGKPRWSIERDLGSPIDAQVLPGNRLLIAEHGGQRVTERNFKGEILWEHRVTSSPVSVQRLPNGNTFIGTYTEVLEVTRDKKVVYSYRCGKGSYCAQKLRNGHIIYVSNSSAQVVELDAGGKEVRTIPCGAATGWATVEALPGGGFLVAQGNNHKIVEFDASGKQVWECASVSSPNAATRLPNGHTLACSNNERHVMEVDRSGKVVWQTRLDGRPFRIRRR
jgi:hypothetical protein